MSRATTAFGAPSCLAMRVDDAQVRLVRHERGEVRRVDAGAAAGLEGDRAPSSTVAHR